MKRLIITSILALSLFDLYAQLSSPYVEAGSLIINNTGFKATSIRAVALTHPTPMHVHNGAVNATFPARFVVARVDVPATTWAGVCGWNTVANSTVSGASAAIIPTGCAAYFEPGLDAIVGTWRVPTQREMTIIVISRFELAVNPLFTQLGANNTYWTATQNSAAQSWAIILPGSIMYNRSKTISLFARCVRDL